MRTSDDARVEIAFLDFGMLFPDVGTNPEVDYGGF